MTDSEIDDIARGFCARTLPKARWTHAAHFATAIWLIRNRPDIVPERDMPDMIRGYNESTGGVNSDSAGYHETITQASLRATRALLATLDGDATPAVAFAALMASPLGDKNWLFAHWSRDLLLSADARHRWVEPDLSPLRP